MNKTKIPFLIILLSLAIAPFIFQFPVGNGPGNTSANTHEHDPKHQLLLQKYNTEKKLYQALNIYFPAGTKREYVEEMLIDKSGVTISRDPHQVTDELYLVEYHSSIKPESLIDDRNIRVIYHVSTNFVYGILVQIPKAGKSQIWYPVGSVSLAPVETQNQE